MADVDIFLKLGSIKGESQDDKHKDEIQVTSFHWSAANSADPTMGMGQGAGKVHVESLVINKRIDFASPKIFQACCTGEHIPDAAIVARVAGKTQVDYMQIKLTDVMVSQISFSGQSAGQIGKGDESISLAFTKCNIDYWKQKNDGSQGDKISGGWDLKANKAAAT